MIREEKLQAIISLCEGLIEKSKNRTKGNWVADSIKSDFNYPYIATVIAGNRDPSEDGFGISLNYKGATYDPLRVSKAIDAYADAVFIASCAGNAEAGWKSTIKCINILRRQASRFRMEGFLAGVAAMEEEMDSIIEEWEDRISQEMCCQESSSL